MKVCCVFSLESPHQCDSNVYTQYTIFKKKKKKKITKSAAIGFFYDGPKNEFETAAVNEPSVFELVEFYCITLMRKHHRFKEIGSVTTL